MYTPKDKNWNSSLTSFRRSFCLPLTYFKGFSTYFVSLSEEANENVPLCKSIKVELGTDPIEVSNDHLKLNFEDQSGLLISIENKKLKKNVPIDNQFFEYKRFFFLALSSTTTKHLKTNQYVL